MEYVNNTELRTEMIVCLKSGLVSNKLGKMFLLISQRTSDSYSYTFTRDKEDCAGYAVLEIMKYWRKYDPTRSLNAFAFITQISWQGLKKGFTKLKCEKSVKLILFDIDEIKGI